MNSTTDRLNRPSKAVLSKPGASTQAILQTRGFARSRAGLQGGRKAKCPADSTTCASDGASNTAASGAMLVACGTRSSSAAPQSWLAASSSATSAGSKPKPKPGAAATTACRPGTGAGKASAALTTSAAMPARQTNSSGVVSQCAEMRSSDVSA